MSRWLRLIRIARELAPLVIEVVRDAGGSLGRARERFAERARRGDLDGALRLAGASEDVIRDYVEHG